MAVTYAAEVLRAGQFTAENRLAAEKEEMVGATGFELVLSYVRLFVTARDLSVNIDDYSQFKN
jgi:hypothetical protein